MAVLIVLAAALGVAVVVLAIALSGTRRDRAESVAALELARAEVADLTAREAAAAAIASGTQRELVEADARAGAERVRADGLDARAAAAEARAVALVEELAVAVEREQQLRAEVIDLTAQAAVAAEALAAAGGRGGDPALAAPLWALELARVDREWRVDAAPIHAPDPPLLPTDPDALERALRMELQRILEEVGTPIALTCDLPTPPDPPTALLALRVAQEILGVAARTLDDVALTVTPTTVTLTGRGTDTAASELTDGAGLAESLTVLGGSYTVTTIDGVIQAEATLPTDTQSAPE